MRSMGWILIIFCSVLSALTSPPCQPIIALAYDTDVIVHRNAAAALRGFSATGNINMKIVQEGGLEPLSRLLLSQDCAVLQETTACLCNLSLGDENKFEICKSGAVAPLITLVGSEDSFVAQCACECLANVAEMNDNQEAISKEGAIIPCIKAMRSRHIEVMRESSRLLSNLSACDSPFAADQIIKNRGHDLLISFLLNQDVNCQRNGAFGIGNLCTHDHHRVALMDAGVLEPLVTLARSGKVELEIRRFCMLALANFASSFKTHDAFMSHHSAKMLVSFSNSTDAELRNYAAFTVAKLAANSNLTEIISDEGGLEPVLFLARSDDKRVQKHTLKALTTLSFVECNKEAICTVLPLISDFINDKSDVNYSQLACCAVANLAEAARNLTCIALHGCIPLIVEALDSPSEAVQREAARAVGNVSVNIDYCEDLIRHGAAPRLISIFQSRNCECQKMVALALSNLSVNILSHPDLITSGIITLVRTECLASLDPKRFSDHETVRFCILTICNLMGNENNHSIMVDFIGKWGGTILCSVLSYLS